MREPLAAHVLARPGHTLHGSRVDTPYEPGRIDNIARARRARHRMRGPEREHFGTARTVQTRAQQTPRQVRVVVPTVPHAIDLDRSGEHDELFIGIDTVRAARVTRGISHYQTAGAVGRIVA